MNVIKEPGCEGWELYLGDWGYNTPDERAKGELQGRQSLSCRAGNP